MLTQRRPRAQEGRLPAKLVLPKINSECSHVRESDNADISMEVDEFRRRGKDLVDFIADHHLSLLQRTPTSPVLTTSNTLTHIMADEAPRQGVSWDQLMIDFSTLILPGVTAWQHPNFHSYFPVGHSFPSVCAELLMAGLGSVSFKCDISPSFSELEQVVMRWMGRLLNLPASLISAKGSGSIIMSTAGDAANSAAMAARKRAFQRHLKEGQDKFDILRRLVMFCSSEGHLTVKKPAEVYLVELRIIPTDKRGILCPWLLSRAMEEEVARGRIPFLVCATVGTTGTCAIDPLEQIGPICKRFDCWLHVDAAYAGSACICPEFRPLLSGIEYADSLVINAHKLLLVNFDCSLVWMKDFHLLEVANTEKNNIYNTAQNWITRVPEHMNFHLPFGQRFRALKLWLVLSVYGVNGIQKYIRNHVRLACEFEKLISTDDRFEVTDSCVGLVCFRLKAGSMATRKLEAAIRTSGSLDIRSATEPGTGESILRFVACSAFTTSEDIQFAVGVIKNCAFHMENNRSNRSMFEWSSNGLSD